jgi:hypothetical protein
MKAAIQLNKTPRIMRQSDTVAKKAAGKMTEHYIPRKLRKQDGYGAALWHRRRIKHERRRKKFTTSQHLTHTGTQLEEKLGKKLGQHPQSYFLEE